MTSKIKVTPQKMLASDEVSSEPIENILAKFSAMDINAIDETKDAQIEEGVGGR